MNNQFNNHSFWPCLDYGFVLKGGKYGVVIFVTITGIGIAVYSIV